LQQIAKASRNKAFDAQVPLLDVSFSSVFKVAKVITRSLFKFFAKVEDFDTRVLKVRYKSGVDALYNSQCVEFQMLITQLFE